MFLAFALLALLLYELGFRFGRWWQDRTPEEKEGPTGMLVGSILALMAFLLAITMGMATDRYDTRRGLVLDGGQLDRHDVPARGLPSRAGVEPEPGAAARVRAAAHRPRRRLTTSRSTRSSPSQTRS